MPDWWAYSQIVLTSSIVFNYKIFTFSIDFKIVDIIQKVIFVNNVASMCLGELQENGMLGFWKSMNMRKE
jgi:hypothetical protein